MDVSSYLEGTPNDIFTDTFVNIDDLCYYNRYFSGYSGIIKQGDQGYVNYIQAGDQIYPSTFYATNPNVGVSSLYDLVAENLFLEPYVEESNGIYASYNTDVIAVACNFSGYMETAMLIAPEKVSLIDEEDGLMVYFAFEVPYIDEELAEWKMETGHCQLHIHDIGLTENKTVEAYLLDPTRSYAAPASWNEDETALFDSYFNGVTPPFVTGASYAYSLESKETYDGVNLVYTDLASGNVLPAYQLSLEKEGYNITEEKGVFTKVLRDDEKGKLTTYTITMVYLPPEEQSGLHTIGFHYPKGVFQAEFKVRITNLAIRNAADFNAYVAANGLSAYIPALPADDTITRISGFEDRTANMNQYYGDYYLFYTSNNYMRLYIEDFEQAQDFALSYLLSLRNLGYTADAERGLGTVSIASPTWNDSFSSYVSITDPYSLSKSSYPGYLLLRYCLYTPEHYVTPTKNYVPLVIAKDERITSFAFYNQKGIPLYGWDPTDSNPIYFAFTALSGYEILGLSIEEDQGATITYQQSDDRYKISLSAAKLDSIHVVIAFEAAGYSLTVEVGEGADFAFLSLSDVGLVPENQYVSFVLTIASGYRLDSIYIKEQPTYAIRKITYLESAYEFNMPGFDATLVIQTHKVTPEEAKLLRLRIDATKLEFTQGDAFSFEGAIYAVYEDGREIEVTDNATFSGFDSSTLGEKTISVSYDDGKQSISATYVVKIVPSTYPTQVEGHRYVLKKRLGGVDTFFRFTFKENGMGEYTRTPVSANDSSSASIHFAYTQEGDSITMVLLEGSDSFSSFSTLRPFDSDIVDETTFNATGKLLEGGVFTITLYGVNGSSPSTQTFAFES